MTKKEKNNKYSFDIKQSEESFFVIISALLLENREYNPLFITFESKEITEPLVHLWKVDERIETKEEAMKIAKKYASESIQVDYPNAEITFSESPVLTAKQEDLKAWKGDKRQSRT